jgi:hypothetical protein
LQGTTLSVVEKILIKLTGATAATVVAEEAQAAAAVQVSTTALAAAAAETAQAAGGAEVAASAGAAAAGMTAQTVAAKAAKTASEQGSASILAMVGTFAALAAGVVVAAGALVSLGAKTADTIDKIEDMSQGLGISAIELSKYQTAAEKIPGGLETFGKALAKLENIKGKAAQGDTTAIALMERLGITATMTADESLKAYADALQRQATSSDRVALATATLGDELAVKLAPALDGGAAGVQRLIDQNAKLGRQITEETLTATRRYQDGMDALAAAWEGLTTTWGSKALPLMAELVSQLEAASRGINIFSESARNADRIQREAAAAGDEARKAATDLFATYRVGVPAVTALEEATAAVNTETRRTSTQSDGLRDRLTSLITAGLTPLERAYQEAQQAQADLTRGLDRGLITASQYAVAMVGVERAIMDAEDAAGLYAGQVEDLSTVTLSAGVATTSLITSIDRLGPITQIAGGEIESAMMAAQDATAALVQETGHLAESLGAVAGLANQIGVQGVGSILSAVSALGQVKDGLSGLLGTASLILEIFGAILSVVDRITEAATGMGLADLIAGGVGAGVAASLATFDLGGFVLRLAEGFTAAIEVVAQSLPSLLASLTASMPSILDALVGSADELGQIAALLILEIIKNLPRIVVALVKILVIAVGEMFKVLYKGYADLARKFGGWLVDGLQAIGQRIADFFREAIASVLEAAGLDRMADKVRGGGNVPTTSLVTSTAATSVTDVQLPAGPSRTIRTTPGDAVVAYQQGGSGDLGSLLRKLISVTQDNTTELRGIRLALNVQSSPVTRGRGAPSSPGYLR